MNFILRPFVSEEIHNLKMKKIILLSLFVLVILTFWQFIIVPSFILNKENFPSEKYLLLLKEQEMYDKYQLLNLDCSQKLVSGFYNALMTGKVVIQPKISGLIVVCKAINTSWQVREDDLKKIGF